MHNLKYSTLNHELTNIYETYVFVIISISPRRVSYKRNTKRNLLHKYNRSPVRTKSGKAFSTEIQERLIKCHTSSQYPRRVISKESIGAGSPQTRHLSDTLGATQLRKSAPTPRTHHEDYSRFRNRTRRRYAHQSHKMVRSISRVNVCGYL